MNVYRMSGYHIVAESLEDARKSLLEENMLMDEEKYPLQYVCGLDYITDTSFELIKTTMIDKI